MADREPSRQRRRRRRASRWRGLGGRRLRVLAAELVAIRQQESAAEEAEAGESGAGTGKAFQAAEAVRKTVVGDGGPTGGGRPRETRPSARAIVERLLAHRDAAWQRNLTRRRLVRLQRRGGSPRQIARLCQRRTGRSSPRAEPPEDKPRPAGRRCRLPAPPWSSPSRFLGAPVADLPTAPSRGAGPVRPASSAPHPMGAATTSSASTVATPSAGRYPARMRALARTSRELDDLLASFPALLFALAGGYGSAAQQRKAREMVQDGAPLRQVAAVLGLPLWTRNLPVGAFQGRLGPLPVGRAFGREIGNFIPESPAQIWRWLHVLSLATRAGGETFALWLARNRIWPRKHAPRLHQLIKVLAGFAWFSGHPHSMAGRLIDRPWSPQLGLRAAVSRCKIWYERLLLEYYLGDGLADVWLREGAFAGHQMVALRTPSALCHEAQVMRSCLCDYGPQLGLHDCRLFSLRQNGRSLATVEIRPHPLDPQTLSVWQMRGPGNAACSDAIRSVVESWMKSQAADALQVPDNLGDGDFHEGRWRRLWRPYVHRFRSARAESVFFPDPELPGHLAYFGDAL